MTTGTERKAMILRHFWKIISKATMRHSKTKAGNHPSSLAIRRSLVTLAGEVAGHWFWEGKASRCQAECWEDEIGN